MIKSQNLVQQGDMAPLFGAIGHTGVASRLRYPLPDNAGSGLASVPSEGARLVPATGMGG